MKSERIRVQHLEEQLWQRIRGYREDIERVAKEGPCVTGKPIGDESLVKAIFNYILVKMDIADYDLEETE